MDPKSIQIDNTKYITEKCLNISHTEFKYYTKFIMCS